MTILDLIYQELRRRWQRQPTIRTQALEELAEAVRILKASGL